MADPPAPAPAPCRHPSSTGKVVRGTVCDDCHAVLSWRPPEPKDSVSPAPASAKDPGVIYCRKCGVKMLRYGSGEYGVMCDCVGEAGTTETPPAPTPADLTTPPKAGAVTVLYYCSDDGCRLVWGSDGDADGPAECLRCNGVAYPYLLWQKPDPAPAPAKVEDAFAVIRTGASERLFIRFISASLPRLEFTRRKFTDGSETYAGWTSVENFRKWLEAKMTAPAPALPHVLDCDGCRKAVSDIGSNAPACSTHSAPAPTLTEPDAVTRAKGAWDRVQREEEVYGTGSLNGTLLREAAGRCVPALLEEIARLRKEIALCTGPVHTAAEFRAALAEKKEAK